MAHEKLEHLMAEIHVSLGANLEPASNQFGANQQKFDKKLSISRKLVKSFKMISKSINRTVKKCKKDPVSEEDIEIVNRSV